jgi:uncharacterized protein
MLVRYQVNNGVELYAYKMGDKLSPYNLQVGIGSNEAYEFKDACKHMKKWNKVVEASLLWLEKPVMVACKVANSDEEKSIGLQNTDSLEKNKGMYFPYEPGKAVSFHQGTVSYPLDIIFFKNESVVKMEKNTKVGSSDLYSCSHCDGVLEVSAGFCDEMGVKIGDTVAFFGLTAKDLTDYQKELESIASESSTAIKGYIL